MTIQLPYEIIITPKGKTSTNKCNNCENTIGCSPWLKIFDNNRLISELYCSKCSRTKLETIIAKMKFTINDIEKLLNEFPKKVKTQIDDINVATII
jgi:hypothetical protein